MGIGKIIKAGLALYGAHELLKDRKNRRQDDYEYDRYCYGEDDSF